MSDHKRVRVLAEGRVQGVFFRDSTRREADRLGVTGWVTNRPDGRVEAEFQGPAEAVDQAVAFCRHGPGHADVRDLVVEGLDLVDGEAGFAVR
ncbi:MAG TPA: acylphosphatase [Egibacteraceae bacterium]|jgi:acylphosphatase|nr:acylphosphatase [Egibacteraceae bacterium]